MVVEDCVYFEEGGTDVEITFLPEPAKMDEVAMVKRTVTVELFHNFFRVELLDVLLEDELFLCLFVLNDGDFVTAVEIRDEPANQAILLFKTRFVL